jgi:hypothetical protein
MFFKKLLELNNEAVYTQLKLFGQELNISEEFVTVISDFLAYVYTGKHVTLPKARWILFTKLKEGEDLPPTPSAFYQHCLRALWQTYEWKSTPKNIFPKPGPLQYGWYKDNLSFIAIPMSEDAIPSSILEFVSCKCKGKCQNERYCLCKRSSKQSTCTELCQCSEILILMKYMELNLTLRILSTVSCI